MNTDTVKKNLDVLIHAMESTTLQNPGWHPSRLIDNLRAVSDGTHLMNPLWYDAPYDMSGGRSGYQEVKIQPTE